MVDKIHDVVLADCWLKLKEIAQTTGILEERVGYILHEIFGMKKLSARWVPRLLTPEQKRNRAIIWKDCLARIQRNPRDFFMLVTVDETVIHHCIPEIKEQSMQCLFRANQLRRKQRSAGKVMATIFCDSQGVILMDYLQKGSTITGQHYSDLLTRFDAVLKEKRPRLQRKKLLFHHDNAPAKELVMKASRIVVPKLNELRYELISHRPYSPDLAPSDFFLFPNLKKSLAGKRFASNEEAIATTDGYFVDLETSYFSDVLKRLEHRLKKGIDLRGDYIEK